MLMICNMTYACTNKRCPNRKPHEKNEFCSPGKCSMGETRCIVLDKCKALENLLSAHFPVDAVQEVANQIESIFKEE